MSWGEREWRAWGAEVAYVEPFPECPGPNVQPCWDRAVQALEIRKRYRMDRVRLDRTGGSGS